MRDVSFGQYYPTESVIHRLDPRIKLILSIIYIVMVFFVEKFVGYAMLLTFVFVIILLSKVPPLKVLRSVRAILFLLIFTFIMAVLFYRSTEPPLFSFGFLHIYSSGLIISAKLALRLISLVIGTSILTFTTTPVELTDALERLLKPLAFTKIPHYLAMIMSIALRLIPTLVEETDKIIAAQKARGANFETGNLFKRAKALLPVLIPLFLSSFRRADELAYAMDSRCYRGAEGRTRMKVMRIKIRDIIAFFVMAAMFFVVLTLFYNYFNFGFLQGLV